MRTYAAIAALLAAVLAAFSVAVAGHLFTSSDLDAAAAFKALYDPALLPVFRALALLGGIEMTTLVGLGLFAFLWRHGYRLGALATAALPVDTLIELVYKHTINHPGPPASLSHPDGPSLSELLERGPGGWSFPSGHMARTVVVYGLLAFVVQRLALRPALRRLAAPVAVLLVLVMAFDRLYLEVHWLSDVVGGLLLGTTFLAASISWLEWSEARAAE